GRTRRRLEKARRMAARSASRDQRRRHGSAGAGSGGGAVSQSKPNKVIPIAKPVLGEEEAAAAREAILSGWVTQGPQVAAFEKEFAQYVGAPHACAVSNCTTALHLALHVLGVGPGDEVITVSHSFIATA